MLREKIAQKIFKTNLGLMPTPKDDKDFKTGIFGWFDYVPKHTRHVIEPLSTKDQRNTNTCQWCATTGQKEMDEKAKLSVRSLVIKGQEMGLISGNGFSNLRSGQKVLQKWGILKEGLIDEAITGWNDYSNIKAIAGLDAEAAKHKIASYWSVSNRNDALKLLDEDRVIVSGSKWYSGFNMDNGFSFPWLIYKIIGWLIGGHAYKVIGYDLSYKGMKAYICHNSFGDGWAEGGKFYVSMDWLDKNSYGFFTNLDEVDKEMGEFMRDYDGKNVKGKDSPAIYHIQQGKKKPYPNWESYLAWNGKVRGFMEVNSEILDKLEEGDIMDITKTDYWTFLKDVKEANRLEALLLLINKEN